MDVACKLPKARRAGKGAAITEYVIAVVLIALVIGGFLVMYRKRVAGKVNRSGSAVNRMAVESLDGESSTPPLASSNVSPAGGPWEMAGESALAGSETGHFQRNRMLYVAALIVVVVIVLAVFLIRRRMQLAEEQEDEEATPPGGVRAIHFDDSGSNE